MIEIKFEKAKNPKKKYDAYIYQNKKLIKKTTFGARGYSQFYDQIGVYSKYNNNDPAKRSAYRARHGKIKTGDGRLAYQVKYSPEWFSWNYLW